MNLNDFRLLFTTAIAIMLVVGVTPLLSDYVSFPKGSTEFTELWILGLKDTISGYPSTIRANESESMRVGVSNHMGRTIYYALYVKLKNQTQPFPDEINSEPSPIPQLYEFNFFLKDGETWESIIDLTIKEITNSTDMMIIKKVRLNDIDLSTNIVSIWDYENHGFYYQIFFELWVYNISSGALQFNDRFVSIWLNVTNSEGV